MNDYIKEKFLIMLKRLENFKEQAKKEKLSADIVAEEFLRELENFKEFL